MECRETFLTPEQAAHRLQVKRRTVLAWLRAGKLAGAKIGYRTWRIAQQDIREFVRSRKCAAAVDPEPLSRKELSAVRRGLEEIRAGRTVSFEQVKRENRL